MHLFVQARTISLVKKREIFKKGFTGFCTDFYIVTTKIKIILHIVRPGKEQGIKCP